MSTVSAAIVRGAPKADLELKNSVTPMCLPLEANTLPKTANSANPEQHPAAAFLCAAPAAYPEQHPAATILCAAPSAYPEQQSAAAISCAASAAHPEQHPVAAFSRAAPAAHPAKPSCSPKYVVTTVHPFSEASQSPKSAAPYQCVPSCSIHISRKNLTNRQSAV